MKTDTHDPFRKLMRILTGRKVQNVCVEAGHIYRDQRPGQEQLQSFTIGSDFCYRLIATGIKPYHMVFIDDYNPEEDNFCLRAYMEMARDCDFEPHEVVWESSLVEEAKALVNQLLDRGLAVSNGNDGIITVKNRIRLQCPDGRVSCCTLDAALYLRRFAKHDFSITVLPRNAKENYKDQQQSARRILRLLGYGQQLPMANIFFVENSDITVGLPG
jgi:hypothetical protein